jgi:L-threonylcarbamoyladenylate synthase
MAKIFQSLGDTELVALLRSGAIGVIPTDTVYGLAASIYHAEAVRRMYALKARERKPGTTIAASVAQLSGLGIAPELLSKAARLWPNALSVIMISGSEFAYIHQGVGDSPFRVVGDPALRAVLELTGPLVTTSANDPGMPPASDVQEAKAYFGDTVDFYVDGPALLDRPPSTIVRFSDTGQLELIRAGAVHIPKDGQLG